MSEGEPKPRVLSFQETRDRLSKEREAALAPIQHRLDLIKEQLHLLSGERGKLQTQLDRITYAEANLKSAQEILKKAIDEINPNDPNLVGAMQRTEELERD